MMTGIFAPEIRFGMEYREANLSRQELTDKALFKGVELRCCPICGWTAPMVSYGIEKNELMMDLYCEKCNFETGWHPWKETVESWNERVFEDD